MKKLLLAAPLALGLTLGNVLPVTHNEPITAKAATEWYIEKDMVNMRDLSIKVTKVKFYKMKDALKRNIDVGKDCVIIYYTVKNMSEQKGVYPSVAWDSAIDVKQDKKKLEWLGAPDYSTGVSSEKILSKGQSGKGAVVYHLNSSKKDLKLKVYKSEDFTFTGKKTYKVKF